MSLKSNDLCSRKKKGHRSTHRRREKGHIMMEAEMGMNQL